MPLPAFLVPHTISISPAAANQLGGAAPTSSKPLFVIGAPEAVGGQVVAAMAVKFADPEALGA